MKKRGILKRIIVFVMSLILLITGLPLHTVAEELTADINTNMPERSSAFWGDEGTYDNAWLDQYTGEENNPYIIKTPAEFAALTLPEVANKIKGRYISLEPEGGTIDLSEHLWYPARLEGNSEEDFTYFEGNDTIISGLRIESFIEVGPYMPLNVGGDEINDGDEGNGTGGAAGLFGVVRHARISNLHLQSPEVVIQETSGFGSKIYGEGIYVDVIGTLAGFIDDSRLVFCTVSEPNVSVESITDTQVVGGLAGYLTNKGLIGSSSVTGGEVSLCPGDGFLSDYNFLGKKHYLGGLVGALYQANLLNASAETQVIYDEPTDNTSFAAVGGLAGFSSTNIMLYATCVFNSFSRSDITVTAEYGSVFTGGIVGYLEDAAVNNFFSGNITTNIMVDNENIDEYTGLLFGGVIYPKKSDGEEPEYEVYRNYYESESNYEEVGTVQDPAGLWKGEGENWENGDNHICFADKEILLEKLNGGVDDIISIIKSHPSHYEGDMIDGFVKTWSIYPGINGGYPTFLMPSANLESLGVSSGTLNPEFDKTTSNYTVTVPFSTSSLSVTPVAEDLKNAKITVNGKEVKSGSTTASIDLQVGETPINVVVKNGRTSKTYKITVTRQIEEPSITSIGSTVFKIKETGSFQVTASNNPTSFSYSGNLPSGVKFDFNTGVISGTPEEGSVNEYNLLITATNAGGDSQEQNFTLTVAKGNGATVSGAPEVKEITHYSITINPVTNAGSTGQSVEYAISTIGGVTPVAGWQSETTFSNLNANTTYYIYARTKSDSNYEAGTAKASVAITTKTPAITVTVEGLDNLKVGQLVGNGKIVYTLVNAEYKDTINIEDFTVSGLPAGLTAGTAVRTSETTVEIAVTGTPTIAKETATELVVTNSISNSNIADASAPVSVTGSIQAGTVAKGVGATVSEALEVKEITHHSITVNPVTNDGSTSQSVEYAISTIGGVTPDDGWQSDTTFNNLTVSKAYYIYARTKSDSNYEAGTAKVSVAITTKTPAITVTVEGLDNLKVGQPVENGKIVYTLTNAKYNETINIEDFTVSGLPTGLTAETAVRTSETTVEIAVTGTPTTVKETVAELVVKKSISIASILDASDPVSVTGSIQAGAVAKGAGATVSDALEVKEITHHSIIVNPVLNDGSTSQSIEYAISTTSGVTPTDGWQSEPTFSNLNASKVYYIYARTKSDSNYESGKAKVSEAITTKTPTIAVTVYGLDNLKVGQQVENGKIIYTLANAEYKDAINKEDFTVSGLPAGLTAEAAVRTSETTVEIAITGTPTIAKKSVVELVVKKSISFTNIANASVSVSIKGSIKAEAVAKGDGAAVSGLPMVDTITYNSITIHPVMNTGSTNQTVEYAISSANEKIPETGWQIDTVFNNLEASTSYYIYSRTKEIVNYNAGQVQKSEVIKTKPLVDAEKPIITTQPIEKTIGQGSASTLKVVAAIDDGGELSYQWYRSTTKDNTSGTSIKGANNASYKLESDTVGTTWYYVVVTNTNNNSSGVKTASETSHAVAVTVTVDKPLNPIEIKDTNVPLLEELEKYIKIETDMEKEFSVFLELRIIDDEAVRGVFEELLIGEEEKGVVPFDMSLYIKDTKTKIQPQEGHMVKITMPIPKSLLEYKNQIQPAYIVDGKIQMLSSELIEIDGIWCLVFETDHFSPYALIYSTILEENSIPSTGDAFNQMWIWMSLIMLVGAGMVVLQLQKNN